MISFILTALLYPLTRIVLTYLFIGYTEMTLLALKKHRERFIIVSVMWTLSVLLLSFIYDVTNASFGMSAMSIATGILFYSAYPFKIQKIVKWIHRNKKK